MHILSYIKKQRCVLMWLFLVGFIIYFLSIILKSDNNIVTIPHIDDEYYHNLRFANSELLFKPNKFSKVEKSKYIQDTSLLGNSISFHCNLLSQITVENLIASGYNSLLYRAYYFNNDSKIYVSLMIVSKASNNLAQCLTNSDPIDYIYCKNMADEMIAQEAYLLQKLHNPNIVSILNLCVRVDDIQSVTSSRIGRRVLVVEKSESVWEILRKDIAWRKKVDISIDLAKIIDYLNNNGTRLIPFEPSQFLLSTPSLHLKLWDVGGLVNDSQACSVNEDCYISSTVTTQCENQVCKDFSWKKNMLNAHKHFFSVLLSNQPPLNFRSPIISLLDNIQKVKLSTSELLAKLRKLANISSDINFLNNYKLTNEFDYELTSKQNVDKKSFIYDEIPDAEVSSVHNYHCTGTIQPDQCVFPVDSPFQAKELCTADIICKSVSISTNTVNSKSGWFLAHLKQSNSNLLYKQGSSLFLKREISTKDDPENLSNSLDNDNEKGINFVANSNNEQPKSLENLLESEFVAGKPEANSALEALHADACYSSIYSQYYDTIFKKREEALMNICGWPDFSDSQWIDSMQVGTLHSEGLMKSSKLNPGGGIKLNIGSDHRKKAWMKIKPDVTSQQKHLSQLAFFLLDRMLGLYVTTTTTGRKLFAHDISNTEITVALSKMEIDPSEDSFIGCTLSAWVNSVQGIAGQRWSLTPQKELTWAVSSLSPNQQNQLSFLLINWLGLMPFKPQNAVQVHRGYNIHVDNDAAFTIVPNDIFPYFNNCQFPKHVIEILVKIRDKPYCSIAGIIERVLKSDPLNIDMSSDIIQENISLKIVDQMSRILLQTVEKCIRRFGKNIVLYSDSWS